MGGSERFSVQERDIPFRRSATTFMHCQGFSTKTESITNGRTDISLDPIATNRIEECLWI